MDGDKPFIPGGQADLHRQAEADLVAVLPIALNPVERAGRGGGEEPVNALRMLGLVAAALVVVGLELATRALHLDGLMDSADGYLSGAPRERALAHDNLELEHRAATEKLVQRAAWACVAFVVIAVFFMVAKPGA